MNDNDRIKLLIELSQRRDIKNIDIRADGKIIYVYDLFGEVIRLGNGDDLRESLDKLR